MTIPGGVHRVPSIAVEPVIRLARWRVFEADGKTRHFVGWHVDGHEGRVSNVIRSFDITSRRGETARGRIYVLLGEPGQDSDADYVWAAYRRINKIASYAEVTKEYTHGSVAPMPSDGGRPATDAADDRLDR